MKIGLLVTKNLKTADRIQNFRVRKKHNRRLYFIFSQTIYNENLRSLRSTFKITILCHTLTNLQWCFLILVDGVAWTPASLRSGNPSPTPGLRRLTGRIRCAQDAIADKPFGIFLGHRPIFFPLDRLPTQINNQRKYSRKRNVYQQIVFSQSVKLISRVVN